MTPWAAADRWLFAPGSARRLATVRTAVACVIGLRIALGPFRELDPPPGPLFRPPMFLTWVDVIPGRPWIVALQVVGGAAAIVAAFGRRPRTALLVAWICLLTLAGFKTSYGKVLHNDLLLLLAAIPLLAAPPVGRAATQAVSRRFGWPVRTSIGVIAIVYAAAGAQKLLDSGLDWITSDNMRWVLYQAAAEGRVRWPEVPLAVADRPWLAHLVAGVILGGELLAPLLIIPRRTRPLFVVYAVALHLGTWFTIGLDYWAWALTVAAVLLPRDKPAPRNAASAGAHRGVLRWAKGGLGLALP